MNEKENNLDPKILENLILEFMNEWDRCGKYPDTPEEIKRFNWIYDKMYQYIFVGDIE